MLGEESVHLPVKFDTFAEEQRITHISIDARFDRMDVRKAAIHEREAT